jgi:hypothetical protein
LNAEHKPQTTNRPFVSVEIEMKLKLKLKSIKPNPQTTNRPFAQISRSCTNMSEF